MKMVRTFRNRDLKTNAFPEFAHLLYGQPGDCKDLFGREHAKTRILTESPGEHPGLILRRNAITIVLVNTDQSVMRFIERKPYQVHLFSAIPKGVVDEVVENFYEEIYASVLS